MKKKVIYLILSQSHNSVMNVKENIVKKKDILFMKLNIKMENY